MSERQLRQPDGGPHLPVSTVTAHTTTRVYGASTKRRADLGLSFTLSERSTVALYVTGICLSDNAVFNWIFYNPLTQIDIGSSEGIFDIPSQQILVPEGFSFGDATNSVGFSTAVTRDAGSYTFSAFWQNAGDPLPSVYLSLVAIIGTNTEDDCLTFRVVS